MGVLRPFFVEVCWQRRFSSQRFARITRAFTKASRSSRRKRVTPFFVLPTPKRTHVNWPSLTKLL